MSIAAPQPRVLAEVVSVGWVRDLVLVIGGAALVGFAAQLAIPLPFTPVPLTLQTLAVMIAGAALGSLRGVAAMILYAVAGVVGVPWFAEGTSGIAVPSFGYIVGFILAAFIVGRVAEHGQTRSVAHTAGLMVIGSVVIYAVGVTWLKVAISVDWNTAVSLGMTPFLIGDAVKVAVAACAIPLTWAVLPKLGLSR